MLCALIVAAACAPAAAENVLINNAASSPMRRRVIENGDVLIVDGRITAVGANINAPRGARVVEAQGAFVTPGAFAAMSEVGLSEISGSGAPNDADIEGTLVSAAADAGRAFNPDVTAIPVTRIEGHAPRYRADGRRHFFAAAARSFR